MVNHYCKDDSQQRCMQVNCRHANVSSTCKSCTCRCVRVRKREAGLSPRERCCGTHPANRRRTFGSARGGQTLAEAATERRGTVYATSRIGTEHALHSRALGELKTGTAHVDPRIMRGVHFSLRSVSGRVVPQIGSQSISSASCWQLAPSSVTSYTQYQI